MTVPDSGGECLPQRTSKSLPVVSGLGQTDPGSSPGRDFGFSGLASAFAFVKWVCLLPVALLRVSQELKEAEDGSMSNNSARHDSCCHSILQADCLGSSCFNQPSRHLNSTTVYRTWGDVGLRASHQGAKRQGEGRGMEV